MAHRLLPFRQYNEHEVVNLFSVNLDDLPVDLKLMAPADDGINADGVLVEVSYGAMDGGDVIDVSADARFQGQFSPPVGRNPYPTVPLQVKPTKDAAKAIGMTLAQTLSHDENSENLLYNPVKKDELGAVLSGQAVPVVSRGVFTLHENAFVGVMNPGNDLTVDAVGAAGKFSGVTAASAGTKIGTVLATGQREDWTKGSDSLSGYYAVVQLALPAS